MGKIREQEPERFSEFWDIWRPHARHTDGRGDARNTYRKHILMGAEPQDIIDGASGFFRFMPDKDRPYVPLASSWLNKEAYPDWADRERRYQAHQAEKAENPAPKVVPPSGQTAFLRKYQEQQSLAGLNTSTEH